MKKLHNAIDLINATINDIDNKMLEIDDRESN